MELANTGKPPLIFVAIPLTAAGNPHDAEEEVADWVRERGGV